MNHDNNIESLIAKVLTGEATPAEIAELELWKNAAAENRDYLQSMVKLFQLTGHNQVTHSFNTDVAWEKVKQDIDAKSPAKVFAITRNRALFGFLRIAAMLLLVAGIGFSLYKVLQKDIVAPVVIVSNNEIKEFLLPDSTTIVMNRNTRLSYTFTNDKRKVELKGEALFDLTSDPVRPFEVVAAGVTIRDLGTAFNVKAHEGNDSMVVHVLHGEVKLTSPKNQSIILKKGEEALYLKSRDEFIRMAVADTNATAYRTKIFVFENASLESVIQKLNEVYGIQISIAEAIRSCRLTATFKNEDPEAIVDIIAETLQLEVSRSGNKISLNGMECVD